jgi:hypothetical protein
MRMRDVTALTYLSRLQAESGLLQLLWRKIAIIWSRLKHSGCFREIKLKNGIFGWKMSSKEITWYSIIYMSDLAVWLNIFSACPRHQLRDWISIVFISSSKLTRNVILRQIRSHFLSHLSVQWILLFMLFQCLIRYVDTGFLINERKFISVLDNGIILKIIFEKCI